MILVLDDHKLHVQLRSMKYSRKKMVNMCYY